MSASRASVSSAAEVWRAIVALKVCSGRATGPGPLPALLERVVKHRVTGRVCEISDYDGVLVSSARARDVGIGGPPIASVYGSYRNHSKRKFLTPCLGAHCGQPSLRRLQFLRQLSIAHFVGEKVVEMNANSVLNLGFSYIVQVVFPTAEIPQHVGDTLRCEDVARVTAIHHALCDVDPPPQRFHSHLCQLPGKLDRYAIPSAVEFPGVTPAPGYLKCASRRCFRIPEKDKGHSVACRTRIIFWFACACKTPA